MATWNKVDGATGYEVTTATSTTVTTEPTIAVEGEKGMLSVKVLGNGVTTLDSEVFQTVYGIKGNNGQICSFDDPLYTYMVTNSISLANETSGYTVKDLQTSYEDGKVTASFGPGGWVICSAIKVIFPEHVSAKAGDVVRVKMNIETEDNIKEVIVNDTGAMRVGYDNIQKGSYLYTFTLGSDRELDGLQFLFITTDNSKIQNVKVTFEFIDVVKGA